MVVIVFGLPGSGKSFFAQRLAARMRAGYISSDRLRKEMFADRTYTENEKLSVYDEMRTRLQQAIEQNKSLVLDATFYTKALRRKFAEQPGDKVAFIEVKANEAVIKERLKQIRVDSDADFAVYERIRAEFEPMEEPHLILYSSNHNIDEMISSAMTYLKLEN